MIDYYLKPYVFTGNRNTYSAQIVNSRSYTFDDIAKYLLRHNTGLSGAVIYGLWEGIKGAVEEFVSDGGSVNTELFNIQTSIRGIFSGEDDGFDGRRHKIRLNMQPGLVLRDVPGRIKVRKLVSRSMAMIMSVTDMKSGSTDSVLSPGGNIRILGQKLKIIGDSPACGLCFVPDDASATPVMVPRPGIIVNSPSEIIAAVPALERGIWSVRIVTQFCKGNRSLKTPRSIGFEGKLRVE